MQLVGDLRQPHPRFFAIAQNDEVEETAHCRGQQVLEIGRTPCAPTYAAQRIRAIRGG